MCASFAAEIYLWISRNSAWCLLDASQKTPNYADSLKVGQRYKDAREAT
jgi:hypothetical protein